MRLRAESDESYVIGLCDSILNRTATRQHRFDFLRGDPGKRGVCVQLPVDAYYDNLLLVVEYWERQHTEPTPFMDKRMTCSGCDRRGCTAACKILVDGPKISAALKFIIS